MLIRVEHEVADLTVEIEDDGIGGAAPAKGTGLRGLTDRVGALDGRLALDSPPGHGTRIRVRIPLADDTESGMHVTTHAPAEATVGR